MLLAIKDYLMARPKASLHELTQHFGVSPDVMVSMLTIWIDKGKVRRCVKEPHCGVKCMQCRPSTIEWFEWCSPKEKTQ